MKTKLTKTDLVLFSLALLGFGYFVHVYPGLWPEAAIRPSLSRQQVRTKGEAFVKDLGHDLSGYRLELSMTTDNAQIGYLERRFGTAAANRLLRDSIPGFCWEFSWNKSRKPGDDGQESNMEVRIPDERFSGGARLVMDMAGNPLRFEFGRAERDTSMRPPFPSGAESDPKPLAEAFVRTLLGERFGEWTFSESGAGTPDRRPPRRFRWIRNAPVAGETAVLETDVRGGKIRSFRLEYQIPKSYAAPPREEGGAWGIVTVVVYLAIAITVLIVLIRRLQQDAIDLKSGWVLGAIVLAGWALTFVLVQTRGSPWWETVLGFVFTAPFLVGSVCIGYAAAESLSREVWAEKLSAIDFLRKRLFFPELGLSLIRGLAAAFVALGLSFLVGTLAIRFCGGVFRLSDGAVRYWEAPVPFVGPLGKSLSGAVLMAVVLGMFLLSFLKKTFKRTLWVVVIAALVWSVAGSTPVALSFPCDWLVNAAVGLLSIFIAMRYDWITFFAGTMAVPALFHGTVLLHSGVGMYPIQGALLAGAVALVLVWAVLALSSRPLSDGAVRYVPRYVDRMYEKERIQRELEIARNVQLNFLPRIQPQVQGLSVASFCIPAREVGGDYYDFIFLGPRKLGVVIGDVSGKGIPAAFYMTMTKGFLKSQARVLTSPRDVLVHLNSLFYENAERGKFISMIYGVFDLEARTLAFARAGHNPMIVKRSGGGRLEELYTGGMALGLEPGPLFNKNIEEKTVPLQKGDIYFFYTDGLNEAKNRFQEEFGEGRLQETLEANEHLSAEGILNAVRKAIQSFASDVLQHDDMTAVVVKILS